MNAVYQTLSLWINFFQPSMKLKEKHRMGPRVTKRYDTAKTPYQRVLESPDADEVDKEHLRETYEGLNPAVLRPELKERLEPLWSLGS